MIIHAFLRRLAIKKNGLQFRSMKGIPPRSIQSHPHSLFFIAMKDSSWSTSEVRQYAARDSGFAAFCSHALLHNSHRLQPAQVPRDVALRVHCKNEHSQIHVLFFLRLVSFREWCPRVAMKKGGEVPRVPRMRAALLEGQRVARLVRPS